MPAIIDSDSAEAPPLALASPWDCDSVFPMIHSVEKKALERLMSTAQWSEVCLEARRTAQRAKSKWALTPPKDEDERLQRHLDLFRNDAGAYLGLVTDLSTRDDYICALPWIMRIHHADFYAWYALAPIGADNAERELQKCMEGFIDAAHVRIIATVLGKHLKAPPEEISKASAVIAQDVQANGTKDKADLSTCAQLKSSVSSTTGSKVTEGVSGRESVNPGGESVSNTGPDNSKNASEEFLAAPTTEPPTDKERDIAKLKEERRALRNAYRDECRDNGIRLTDEMIALAANANWTSRTQVQKWIQVDPRYESADPILRKVFRQKPHLNAVRADKALLKMRPPG